jgi:hypothetical protein
VDQKASPRQPEGRSIISFHDAISAFNAPSAQKYDRWAVKCGATLFIRKTPLFDLFLVKSDFFAAFYDQITCQMLETSLKPNANGQNLDGQ